VRDAGAGLVLRDVKTAKGRRAVPLTAGVVEQAARAQAPPGRASTAARRQQPGGLGLIFTTQAGGRSIRATCRAGTPTPAGRAGVDAAAAGLHALRHSAATAMLQAGAPVRVVADVLGHSSAVITLDVYQDVDAAGLRAAVEAGESRTAAAAGPLG